MSDDLLTRLRKHIAQMAPHQKERHGGKLLVEAEEEIERLLGIIARDQEELREALRREVAPSSPAVQQESNNCPTRPPCARRAQQTGQ